MREKKVVAVIMEGPSDEAALGSVLKEHYSSSEVQSVVVHGDITTEDYSSTDNIISKISDLINGVKSRYGYKPEDFCISFILRIQMEFSLKTMMLQAEQIVIV